MTIKFTGRHFPSEIILQSVRYYLSYKLSYREIEEVLAERGINVELWHNGHMLSLIQILSIKYLNNIVEQRPH
jgi:transposase-like protein